MNILWLMMPISIFLGSFFLACFILASKNDQFEDLETPALKILIEDKNINNQTKENEHGA